VVLDIGTCLITAGILSVVFTRLKIPNIAAFLAAGVIVGPVLGQLVTDSDNIRTIAELGLILLLFVIGVEIDLKKLLASGKVLIVTGLLQFPLCIGFGWGVAWLAGAAGWDSLTGQYTALYAGIAAAASSTLLVVKFLQEKFQLDTVVGRVSLGILIFQDIWAIVVLAIQPNLASPAIGPIAQSFAGIGLLMVLAILIARFVLPVAFRWVAKTPELMLLTAVAWCFGLGYLGANFDVILNAAGIGGTHLAVSEAMGALIAGATVASLPYAHDVTGKVGTVRDFFVTLFFVGLGMGIPVPDGVETIMLALFLGGVALASRYVVFFPLMYYSGLDRRSAFVGATKLAPISEFCLVIGYIGVGFGHIDAGFQSSLIFAFVILALTSPFIFGAGDAIHDRIGGLLTALRFRVPPSGAHGGAEEQDEYVLAVLGFHRIASSLIHELGEANPEMLKRTLVVDFNAGIHGEIAALGPTVKYGDLSNTQTLHHVGVDRAHVLLCTIPDDVLKGTSNLKLLHALNHINPKAAKIMTANDFASAKAMYAAGAAYVLMPRVAVARGLIPVLTAAVEGRLIALREDESQHHGSPDLRREVFE
jgi:Kef-type K+ transport system membrane component KefB